MLQPKPIEPTKGLRCGPAALCCITGHDYKTKIRPTINSFKRTKRPNQAVLGMHCELVGRVLHHFGYEMTKLADYTILKGLKKPTFKSLFEDKSFDADTLYLVNVTGHFVIYHQGIMYDNWSREGCVAQEHHSFRQRVKRIYKVGLSTEPSLSTIGEEA